MKMNTNPPAPPGDNQPHAPLDRKLWRSDETHALNWGKTWRITPTREEQRLWTWACSAAKEKLIPFIMRAIHRRCAEVIAERIARGAKVDQWVVEKLEETDTVNKKSSSENV